jgi:protein-disulfide isomerase
VTRLQEMLDAGITGTPTLVVNGETKSVGRALDVPAIMALLSACREDNPR